jgi:predicted phosphodiesterase
MVENVDVTWVRLGVVSDTHIAPAGTPHARWHNPLEFEGAISRLQLAVERFHEAGVDGVVMLGDLSHYGDAESLGSGKACLADGPGRLWVVSGNHDLPNGASGPGATGGENEVLADGLRLAVLPIGRDRDGSFRSGALWLEAWGDDVTLIASHYPLISREIELAEHGLPYPGDLSDQPQLLETLDVRSVPTVVLSGHLHVRDSCRRGQVLQLSFASMIEYPFECSIVEIGVQDGRLRLGREAIGLQTGTLTRDPVLVPAAEGWEFGGREWRPDPSVTATVRVL